MHCYALHLLHLCVSPQRALNWTAYPRTIPLNAPRTYTVPPHPLLLSRRVLSLCLRSYCFYRATYFHRVSAPTASVAQHTTALLLSLHFEPPHLGFCRAAYSRTAPSSGMRTPVLAPLIAWAPLIRAKLAVHQCATDSQMPRSDHAPERSHFIDSLSTSLLYRSSF